MSLCAAGTHVNQVMTVHYSIHDLPLGVLTAPLASCT